MIAEPPMGGIGAFPLLDAAPELELQVGGLRQPLEHRARRGIRVGALEEASGVLRVADAKRGATVGENVVDRDGHGRDGPTASSTAVEFGQLIRVSRRRPPLGGMGEGRIDQPGRSGARWGSSPIPARSRRGTIGHVDSAERTREQPMSLFAVTREAGPGWTDGQGAFEQTAVEDHAAFMNGLESETWCCSPDRSPAANMTASSASDRSGRQRNRGPPPARRRPLGKNTTSCHHERRSRGLSSIGAERVRHGRGPMSPVPRTGRAWHAAITDLNAVEKRRRIPCSEGWS